MKPHIFLSVLFGFVATLFVPAQAQHGATELTGDWSFRRFVQPFEFRGGRTEELRGVWLATIDATQPGIMFTCSDLIGFTVKVALEPRNFSDDPIYEVRRRRQRNAELVIDGEQMFVDFGYMPQQTAAISFDKSIAAKFYNAAILGQTIKFKIAGKPEVDVYLPAADETFSLFRQNCRPINPEAN